jgi:membrane protease YdiL (CAAX protease family)
MIAQSAAVDRSKRLGLPLFFILSLVIAWAIWIPQAAARLGMIDSAVPFNSPLMIISRWAPGLAAILVVWWREGRAGPGKLFHPLGIWRVGIQWYILAFLYRPSIWALSRGIEAILGLSYEWESPVAEAGLDPAAMLPLLIVSAFPTALGEEIGWWGYAFPTLWGRRGALVSSVIIGLIWGMWHVPLWVAYGETGLPLAVMALSTVPTAILFAWVFISTRGSLLLVWLLHGAITIAGNLLPSVPTLTEYLVGWVVAIAIAYSSFRRTRVRR